jgi:hypothetical protein
MIVCGTAAATGIPCGAGLQLADENPNTAVLATSKIFFQLIELNLPTERTVLEECNCLSNRPLLRRILQIQVF